MNTSSPSSVSSRIVIFSGGSAANALVNVFGQVAEGRGLTYVIPVSDNGGSTSEIIRYLGGPGIGDLRSRLVRLIPDDSDDPERHAIRAFFNYRLSTNALDARHEWLDIVEARHELWQDISSPKRELIRSFLNLLNLEIVKRARPNSVFNFQSASVGNLFLTGARLFCGSLESSIYLLSSICCLPPSISVLPAINTNFTHHICAGLANGDTIPGQNSISHPSDPSLPNLPTSALPSPSLDPRPPWPGPAPGIGLPSIRLDHNPLNIPLTHLPSSAFSSDDAEVETADSVEDANLPGSLPTLRKQYITYSKVPSSGPSDLPARIARIWYINPYGQEIRPAANPKIIEAIANARCIIYSIGSLYTSIIPSLILRGVGDAIANNAKMARKVLILNGTVDRESGPSSAPFTAMDFVRAIARAGLESAGARREAEVWELRQYVTHLIYIEGNGVPRVSREELAQAGIEGLRVYGRKAGGTDSKGCYYDEKALTQALQALVGGGSGQKKDPTRRNTLVS